MLSHTASNNSTGDLDIAYRKLIETRELKGKRECNEKHYNQTLKISQEAKYNNKNSTREKSGRKKEQEVNNNIN